MDCKKLKAKLLTGNYMPMIAFGTYKIRGSKLINEVIDIALAAGYRSIDTAAVYGNETDIGAALKTLLPKYKLKRENIYITTKLAPSDHADKVLSALTNSLQKLDCDYIDLYLVHWPGQAGTSAQDPTNLEIRTKTWEQLVEAKKRGLVKDIGVSNYTVRHLEELLSKCFGEKPVVNQVEWHPHYHQLELKTYCEKHEILLQAYSSLGGTSNPNLISDPNIVEIAKKLNRQPAQILLRWALQQNIAIIPKACSRKHIEANIDLDFEIPDTDMAALNNMETVCKYAWDPDEVA